MSKSLDEIQDMLDTLPSQTWRFDKVKEDALTYTGALRTETGQNVVEPGPESASMIVGLRASIDFLSAAPQIVQQLLDRIKELEAVEDALVAQALPDIEIPKNVPATPKTGANKPISA